GKAIIYPGQEINLILVGRKCLNKHLPLTLSVILHDRTGKEVEPINGDIYIKRILLKALSDESADWITAYMTLQAKGHGKGVPTQLVRALYYPSADESNFAILTRDQLLAEREKGKDKLKAWNATLTMANHQAAVSLPEDVTCTIQLMYIPKNRSLFA